MTSKLLNIQIQPDFLDGRDMAPFVEMMESCPPGLGDVGEVQSEPDHTDITFKTNDLMALWDWIQQEFDEVKRATIVVCEGDHGWNDYLMLHHFDPNEQHGVDILT